MTDSGLLALALFFGCVLLGRFVSESALARLEPERREALQAANARVRLHGLLGAAAALLLALSLPQLAPYVVAAYVAFYLAVSYAAVRQADAPASYLRAHAVYTALYLVGLIGALALIYRAPPA